MSVALIVIVIEFGYIRAALGLLLTTAFFAAAAMRLLALYWFAYPAAAPYRRPLSDAELPTYSVLVPLYGEAAVLPALLEAMTALDYPRGKLDIVFVLEAADTTMAEAFARHDLPHYMRAVVVPDVGPRTKPKALNYALTTVASDYIVVFDAEDRPERDQLRRAAEVFRGGNGRVGCLQAQLNLYNPDQSWLSRQFTLEYSTHFDAVLPALARIGLPIPLGGTSNHVPRHVLLEVGAWDAFNVTEDADLGVKLARLGYETHILASTTWEEAPINLRQWHGQRTRWLKGWVQTLLVHFREPIALWRDLGTKKMVGLTVALMVPVIAALLHPIFYVLLADALLRSSLTPITVLGVTVAIAGAALSIALSWATVRQRHQGLARSLVGIPLNWLLITSAAYRALVQLVRAPHYWSKTEHGLSAPRPRLDRDVVAEAAGLDEAP
jgi:cellulose synthase/poly-beta-1,6-N-acetylglucosamine synthase-like glycosyltransferase